MTKSPASTPRCAAIVGPYLSGKTTLLESILHTTGAVLRKGSVKEGNTVGDASAEARARQMSVEVSVATTEYLGDKWSFIDCPGSIEFAQEAYNAALIADVGIVVCEAVVERVLTLQPLLRALAERDTPHILFINKIDHPGLRIQEVLEALRAVSMRPLLLREVPVFEDETVTGYIDLVSQKGYRYRDGEASEEVPSPATMEAAREAARTELLESLADFDDTLLEQLLEDRVPSFEEIYDHLAKEFSTGKIVPVFFGSAESDHGVKRLLKALRHEVPGARGADQRLGLDPDAGETVAQVFKTYHAPHTGKLSLARILRGSVKDGMTLNGQRVSGLFRMKGHEQKKITEAPAGEVVALGRMDKVRTGDALTPSGSPPEGLAQWPPPLSPVYALAIDAEDKADEVKLSGALAKLIEEDPSLSCEQNRDTLELLLRGQGEIHLLVGLERLHSKYHLLVGSQRPTVPYQETITKAVSQHGRYKRQTGGHGQFGDVHLDIKPLPRGSGFSFANKIVGGAVPKQYIPGVRTGVKEYMGKGPLGFPVVDLAVTLTDGQFHAVDSSELAFRQAARIAMTEGMAKCGPVLLEPIFKVALSLPSDFTAKAQRLISGRRGQILGFEPKSKWEGWDELTAYLPQAESHDLIVDLRSLSLGIGTFSWNFDHLQPVTGRIADQVIEARAAATR
jgi:elongation factor G